MSVVAGYLIVALMLKLQFLDGSLDFLQFYPQLIQLTHLPLHVALV